MIANNLVVFATQSNPVYPQTPASLIPCYAVPMIEAFVIMRLRVYLSSEANFWLFVLMRIEKNTIFILKIVYIYVYCH